MGVFKNSHYPELGKEFLKYFLKNELELLWAVPGLALPVLKDAVDAWEKHSLLREYPEIIETLLKATQPGIGFPPTKGPGMEKASSYWLPITASSVVADAIQKVTLKNEKVEEATAWAAKELKDIVSRYK